MINNENKVFFSYKNRALVVHAIKYEGQNLSMVESNWDNDPRTPDKKTIKTLEGRMQVSIGDYIIEGIKGEFYPCKADIFESSYDLVEPESAKENWNFKENAAASYSKAEPDFWYDLSRGGYLKPSEILQDREQVKKVEDALKILESFEIALDEIMEELEEGDDDE